MQVLPSANIVNLVLHSQIFILDHVQIKDVLWRQQSSILVVSNWNAN